MREKGHGCRFEGGVQREARGGGTLSISVSLVELLLEHQLGYALPLQVEHVTE